MMNKKSPGQLFQRFTSPIKNALDHALGNLNFSNIDEARIEAATTSIAILCAGLLKAAKTQDLKEITSVKTFLKENYGDQALTCFTKEMAMEHEIDWTSTCEPLNHFSSKERHNLLKAFIHIAYFDNDYIDSEQAFIERLANELKTSEAKLAQLQKQVIDELDKQNKIALSLAGLLAALVVFVLFLIFAIYLKSVLIGVALAYFFLPLQQLYLKKLVPSKFIQGITKLMPSKKQKSLQKSTPRNETKRSIDLACNLTIISVFLAVLVGASFFTWGSYTFIQDTRTKLDTFRDQRLGTYEKQLHKNENTTKTINTPTVVPSPEPPKSKLDAEETQDSSLTSNTTATPIDKRDYITWIRNEVGAIQTHIQKIPLLSSLITELQKSLEDENTQEKIIAKVIEASGGILGTLKVLASTLFGLILDFCMGLFFFIFFLNQMAVFRMKSASQKPGQYLIDTIFGSTWMPNITTATKKEASDVLDAIISKMQTWVRGCMTIILIELPIFLIIFSIMGVPFALPLAMASSMVVLLPILGPPIVITSNILLCLATGHNDPVFIVGILSVYLIITFGFEALFLYPTLVGKSLGLSFLETIIVVLMGGLTAGIAGAVFGVPAASIIKYLSPRIYRSLRSNRKGLDDDHPPEDYDSIKAPS
jgi:predicted PurR-regulated permease PerM/uncharacterized tellurite resistance protein B-like protein